MAHDCSLTPSGRRRWLEAEKRKDGPDLIPVRLVASEISEDPYPKVVADTRVPSVIEIHLSNGHKVVVPEDIPPARLQDLLSVVAGR